jgi:hypothetical protein
MSRKRPPVGGQDGDNAVRGMVTLSPDGKGAPYTPTAPEPVPIADPVTVRAVRPHDTVEGLKLPGDEYQRARTEAEILRNGGILAIIE